MRNSPRCGFSCWGSRVVAEQLFSGSFDRTVKIWNLDDMAYVWPHWGVRYLRQAYLALCHQLRGYAVWAPVAYSID